MKSREENLKILGDNLKRYIGNINKNAKAISKELDIPYPTFMQWTEGYSYPPIERIMKIADYFHVEITDLILENSVRQSNQKIWKDNILLKIKLVKAYQQLGCQNPVMCRDCKHYDETWGICEHFSSSPDSCGAGHNSYTEPNDYCSFALQRISKKQAN